MRTIEIDPFKQSDINKAIKKLKEYSVWVQQKSEELIDRLADIGVSTAQVTFDRTIEISNGATIHARLEPVIVVKNRIFNNCVVISAQGEDVCFIEFGAGIRYGRGYPSDRPQGVVGIGEYGKGKGNNPKGWGYVGKDGMGHHSYGNPPAMAMWKSEKVMIEEIANIAREVFRG